MRRTALRFGAFMAAAALLLVPVIAGLAPSSSSSSPDPVTISTYTAHYSVNADGVLTARETIVGDFPYGRHGIFRYWDVANQNNSRLRQVPEITSITMDGSSIPYELLWETGKRFRVAKIGDPGSTLNWGTHVFEIRYTIDGVLDPGAVGAHREFAANVGNADARSAFYWNVVAPAWNNTQPYTGFVYGARCVELGSQPPFFPVPSLLAHL